MNVDFLVFKEIWDSQGCRDLRGLQGQWAPREIWVSLELPDRKECEVLLVCQASQETQDCRVSMETMAHLVYPVSQDATGLKETEEEMVLLDFLVFKGLLASQEFLE